MKRAFKAPRGAWIAICILAVISVIPDFIKAAEQANPNVAARQIGDCFGQAIGSVIAWWMMWAVGKGVWLGIRALVRRRAATIR